MPRKEAQTLEFKTNLPADELSKIRLGMEILTETNLVVSDERNEPEEEEEED